MTSGRPDAKNGEESQLRWLAFYLPQFHPIPENDEWWGKGFTEWRNVVQSRPRVRGHYQPHLPADLGFYDLRVPETRVAQAQLAAEYGIDGFVYYHYWFAGRRVLNRPLDEVLTSGSPDFPFCLCWANENWTRGWDGGHDQILLEQRYSPDDDLAHIRWLARVFDDSRYVRIDGRPVFLVYRAAALPDPRATADLWRSEAQRLGLPNPYLIRVESFADERCDPADLGFDASVEFQPDWYRLGRPLFRDPFARAWQKFLRPDSPIRRNTFLSYDEIVHLGRTQDAVPWQRYRCVMPSWDNSARRAIDARIILGSTPQRYAEWVRSVTESFVPRSPDENLAFVNAWNEWAEGNHLEPDLRWGTSYLDAHRSALGETTRSSSSTAAPRVAG